MATAMVMAMAVAKSQRRVSKRLCGGSACVVARRSRRDLLLGSASVRVLLVTGMLVPAFAPAAEWRIEPRLGLRETYTDNVSLAREGQEQSDWVTEIEPGVSIRARGARLQLQADYTFQQRLYVNSTDNNGHNHLLNGSGLLDVWNRNLFLQGSASITQQNALPFGPQATSNVSLSNNRTEVRQVNLSPYWVSRLGSWGNLRVRYGYSRYESKDVDDIDSPSGDVGDFNSRIFTVVVSSAEEFRSLRWSADYTRQKVVSDSDEFADRELETIAADLRYQLVPTFALTLRVGYENNDIGPSRVDTSGPLWLTGFDWTPSTRTRVAAAFGHRFYGNTYSLDAAYRTHSTTWTAAYTEQLDATPGQFSSPVSSSTANTIDRLFITQIPDPVERQQVVQTFINQNRLPQTLTSSVDFLSNQVSLTKRLSGGFGYRGMRGSVILHVFREDRRNQTSGTTIAGTDPFSVSDRILQTGMSAVGSWRFTQRTSGLISSITTNSKGADTNVDQTDYTLTVGLAHQFHPKMHGALDVRTYKSDSNDGSSNTRENAIVGTLRITF